MIRHLSLTLALLSCVGCESTRPNFKSMSEDELAAYNATVPLHQQVICEEIIPGLSRVRRRVCMTLMERYGPNDNATAVEVLSAGGLIAR